ncbi:uncharacterized protein EKO05_0002726 [Ascochyta rabiei]|uniref:Uncharacterized protein n=1 Tax=Didymella rabiei TaxID=5454 RepID=A0A163BUQ1_DIDRA|nr:uncharacterized protein EKO05_0002726 [Ascochyta rabiei]KZM22007.1 hypothetical protein ST47_g6850 [Ascochyta rabiei]UPX12160.1 hypothetical protein EKO05_0002726 [Ascochyta rabiei]WPV74376.1 putative effector protein precursor [Ascochyta rabiei]
MRFVLAAIIALPSVLAWDSKVCNGVGGCNTGTSFSEDPFRCPDGSRLNVQQTASNMNAVGSGDYTVVSKAEFPTTCLDGAKPGSSDTLVLHTTEFGQKAYVFIHESCTVTNPIVGDCYNHNPNPFSTTLCQLVDTKGKDCAKNTKADECEKWGTSC